MDAEGIDIVALGEVRILEVLECFRVIANLRRVYMLGENGQRGPVSILFESASDVIVEHQDRLPGRERQAAIAIGAVGWRSVFVDRAAVPQEGEARHTLRNPMVGHISDELLGARSGEGTYPALRLVDGATIFE
jgi:hypothetical protein